MLHCPTWNWFINQVLLIPVWVIATWPLNAVRLWVRPFALHSTTWKNWTWVTTRYRMRVWLCSLLDWEVQIVNWKHFGGYCLVLVCLSSYTVHADKTAQINLFFCLSLKGCCITKECCESLVRTLSAHTFTLRKLDLSDNDLEDEGVMLLSAGLGGPDRTLEVLGWV